MRLITAVFKWSKLLGGQNGLRVFTDLLQFYAVAYCALPSLCGQGHTDIFNFLIIKKR